MDAEERDICDFLKSWPGQFVASREICRRAGGKWRFRDEPTWALPILTRMVEKGLLETDSSGHFKWLPKEKTDKKKKIWISPQVKQALEQSGKDFEIKDEDDTL